MNKPILNYCLVTQNLASIIEDSTYDSDRYPDVSEITGEVIFTPNVANGKAYQLFDREGESYTVPVSRIRAKIINGVITHEGETGVYLFAAGVGSNPDRITYSVEYRNLRSGDLSFSLSPLKFEAIPGGEVDLTMATPVIGATPAGTTKGDKGDKGDPFLYEDFTPEQIDDLKGPLTLADLTPERLETIKGPKGDRGSGIHSVSVDGSDLVFTVDEDRIVEVSRVPLVEAANGIRDEISDDLTASKNAATAAEGYANQSASSASAASSSASDASNYKDISLSAAERAEFAAEETIQQVEGDFATRNYIDTAVGSSRYGQSDSLPADIDLDNLWRATDAKVYRLVSGRSYYNLPTGLSLTTNATLIVSTTGTSGMQMISQNSSGHVFWRPMHGTTTNPRTWLSWRRLDSSSLENTVNLTFQRRAQVEENTDLNTLKGNTENGIRILGSHGNYLNRPESGWSPNTAGAIVVFSTGIGDTWQRVWQRFGGNVWERQESANGGFTDWQRVRYGDSGGSGDGGETTPATALALPQTTFEAVGMLTTYEEGEAYLDLLNARQPMIEVREFGKSYQQRPIRGIVIGDDTKPALFIMCAQHGDEISGRESALIWARQISEMRPDFLDKICVVIVPTVNADKINIRRITSTGTDLNGAWGSRATNEVKAAYAGIEAFDTRAVIDAHEGGSWTQVQLCEGTAPEIDAQVLAYGQAFYDAVWAELEAKGKAVARWEGSNNLTNSRNAIPYQLGIPCLLVEMPGQLAREGWNGPGPDPRIYQPDLSERVNSYRVVFEGAAKYLAGTIPTA